MFADSKVSQEKYESQVENKLKQKAMEEQDEKPKKVQKQISSKNDRC